MLVEEEIPLLEFMVLADDVIVQMAAICDAILAGSANTQIKPEDRSLVTDDDVRSEVGLRESALRFGIAFRGEELGAVAATLNSQYELIVDPLDGTRTRVNLHLAGNTVIAYVYDRVLKRIVFSIIGCPGTGEIVVAFNGTTKYYKHDYETGVTTFVRECRVWSHGQEISRPTVYVDNPNAFTRRGVDMLTNNGLDLLDSRLRRLDLTKFAVGSNGLHHMLVALGGGVVGAITTSIGGIQDLGGILVVENAGGIARAFVLNDDRSLTEVDPHTALMMPGGYDFVVMAVDQVHSDILVDTLQTAASIR